MGKLDIVSKKYFSGKKVFADAFNFFLYKGKQVIDPEKLQEMDTAQVVLPFGNDARLPLQKYRDILKLWSAMMDEEAIYVILGTELQGMVHYAMPVKDGLYDMIGYSKQVDAARESYRRKKKEEHKQDNKSDTGGDKDEESEAEVVIEGKNIKIKVSNEEFLSGFHRDDRLIPIITVVIYLGAEPWDGPLSLYDMFDVKNKELLQYVPNYTINLISPANMEEEDFEKFSTDLGYAMKIIKHQKKDADELLSDINHSKIDADTAFFLNEAVDLNLDLVEEGGEVNMCMAVENRMKREKITGAIEIMKDDGKSDDDIIKKIVEKYKVTREYVLSILTPTPAA